MDDPRLTIHPVPTNDGVIVRVQPPTHPTYTDPRLSHIPCDIVLVIDVSGSMQLEAPAKMNSDDGKLISSERFGLSVLDLTKHAARTILSTLDQWDRLGIVTFSSRARVSFSCPFLEFRTFINRGRATNRWFRNYYQ